MLIFRATFPIDDIIQDPLCLLGYGGSLNTGYLLPSNEDAVTIPVGIIPDPHLVLA